MIDFGIRLDRAMMALWILKLMEHVASQSAARMLAQ